MSAGRVRRPPGAVRRRDSDRFLALCSRITIRYGAPISLGAAGRTTTLDTTTTRTVHGSPQAGSPPAVPPGGAGPAATVSAHAAPPGSAPLHCAGESHALLPAAAVGSTRIAAIERPARVAEGSGPRAGTASAHARSRVSSLLPPPADSPLPAVTSPTVPAHLEPESDSCATAARRASSRTATAASATAFRAAAAAAASSRAAAAPSARARDASTPAACAAVAAAAAISSLSRSSETVLASWYAFSRSCPSARRRSQASSLPRCASETSPPISPARSPFPCAEAALPAVAAAAAERVQTSVLASRMSDRSSGSPAACSGPSPSPAAAAARSASRESAERSPSPDARRRASSSAAVSAASPEPAPSPPFVFAAAANAIVSGAVSDCCSAAATDTADAASLPQLPLVTPSAATGAGGPRRSWEKRASCA